jgi:hypothetical protein
MRQISELAEKHSLPETFNDDSIQKRFEGNKAFADSIARETDLLFAAAAAADDATARRLATEARDLMKARRARWYTGKDAFLGRVEDVFLALEGSGQWVGYRWLVDERGANIPQTVAIEGFARRSKWWSQNQGLALLLAVDRIGDGSWRKHAFGDGAVAGVPMLEQALGGR